MNDAGKDSIEFVNGTAVKISSEMRVCADIVRLAALVWNGGNNKRTRFNDRQMPFAGVCRRRTRKMVEIATRVWLCSIIRILSTSKRHKKVWRVIGVQMRCVGGFVQVDARCEWA